MYSNWNLSIKSICKRVENYNFHNICITFLFIYLFLQPFMLIYLFALYILVYLCVRFAGFNLSEGYYRDRLQTHWSVLRENRHIEEYYGTISKHFRGYYGYNIQTYLIVLRIQYPDRLKGFYIYNHWPCLNRYDLEIRKYTGVSAV